jgi:hypothetical protein
MQRSPTPSAAVLSFTGVPLEGQRREAMTIKTDTEMFDEGKLSSKEYRKLYFDQLGYSGVLCALIRLLIFYIRRHNPEFGLDWATATTFICQMVAFALAVIWLGTAAFNIY